MTHTHWGLLTLTANPQQERRVNQFTFKPWTLKIIHNSLKYINRPNSRARTIQRQKNREKQVTSSVRMQKRQLQIWTTLAANVTLLRYRSLYLYSRQKKYTYLFIFTFLFWFVASSDIVFVWRFLLKAISNNMRAFAAVWGRFRRARNIASCVKEIADRISSSVLVRIHNPIWVIQAIFSFAAMRKEACHKSLNHKNIQNGVYSRKVRGDPVYDTQCDLLAVTSYYIAPLITVTSLGERRVTSVISP